VNRSVDFFDSQFRRQIQGSDYVLNPFERAILPYLKDEILDLGCGLGNLSLAAAQAGCSVTALDASPSGIGDLGRRAAAANARIDARSADLRTYTSSRQYDCVVCIGLLMFFRCDEAQAVLGQLASSVRPGGIAAVNVLVAGTTFMDMFDPQAHCLFEREELTSAFAGWQAVLSRYEDFPAPGGTLKRFQTMIARRPL
jgi:tellurite methyltransferase